MPNAYIAEVLYTPNLRVARQDSETKRIHPMLKVGNQLLPDDVYSVTACQDLARTTATMAGSDPASVVECPATELGGLRRVRAIEPWRANAGGS